ncbi:hypothetical protein [Paenibacillus sp. 1_12]|uniref:hypothetical protein n=1 Tax=Paenibacillus sp. 1_12 TaxID=1566278 RepID=UPI00116050F4|nr:hypothetical protein [Paenibacillus sp. 1_12]
MDTAWLQRFRPYGTRLTCGCGSIVDIYAADLSAFRPYGTRFSSVLGVYFSDCAMASLCTV